MASRQSSEPPPVTRLAAWPPRCPAIDDALQAALADGSWGHYTARHTHELTSALARRFQVDHVQLCSSGTIAVEIALHAVGVAPGDEVVVAGYDFPGNFRAIEALGALPVLVDVDPATWSIDPACLAAVDGDKITALVVSHLHGGLAPMPTLRRLAEARGWAIVEDACQAPGAIVEGRPAGAWGDAAALSFGGSKLLTAGRGGAVLTHDPLIHQRGKLYGERGNQAFPLSELQAAVLLPQLEQLAQRNTVRAAAIAEVRRHTEHLHADWRAVAIDDLQQSAYYKHAWSYLPAETDPTARDRLLSLLWSKQAPLDAGFRGFCGRSRRRCRKPVDLSTSRRLSQSTVVLHHPLLLTEAGRASPSPQQATADVIQWAVEQLRSSASP